MASIEERADGSRLQREPDGTEIEVDAAGVKTQRNPDGSSIVEYKDGRSVSKFSSTRAKFRGPRGLLTGTEENTG